ncbi:MAG: sigma 54-interacting transcriptional regulator [Deltaproteobacteria bacterium]|nr:sigma 54-interacting transcriptional regulator [Deltaproteobacteria bacterium]MBW2353401.1 sigma 54-interacting transcriptional regulator [Deltaproteobacteria bacterium]
MSCSITSALRSPCCSILDSISDGVFTIDLNKRITSFNRAAETITGFTGGEAIGQYCFDIFRANICEKRCALDATLASGKPQVNLPALIISKAGDQKPISISTATLTSENGDIIGGVETFRDLTELEKLKRELGRSYTHDDIVGRHPKMKEILSFLPDIAESESPVIVQGPTGSGKELIARAIHHLSPRKTGPFIAVNCAALPETLLESELFGYSKGAFTGAMRDKPGRFLLADKGTLFLDEISSTSTAFQADLLRVLEDGEFTPLGGTRTLKADFRVITATNLQLKKLVEDGEFREDLYYRLNVVKIDLPALRERKDDIPILIEHFIRKFNLLKDRSVQGVAPEVLSFLLGYPFPGNIRQLENIIEYAFITCKGDLIGMGHLPRDLIEAEEDRGPLLSANETEEAEKIQAILDQYPRNRPEAAKALGMSRTTLWRKMKKYGLSR